MRCLICLFKTFFQTKVRPQTPHSHLCFPCPLFPFRLAFDVRQYGHLFLSHTTTHLLNDFNSHCHKMITVNNLIAIRATLFEHFAHSEGVPPRAGRPKNLKTDASPAKGGVSMTLPRGLCGSDATVCASWTGASVTNRECATHRKRWATQPDRLLSHSRAVSHPPIYSPAS
jgi:hypothetical protein